MKKENEVRDRLEKVRALMDARGLPHGTGGKPRAREPLRGVQVRERVFPSDYRHGGILLEDLHGFPGRIFTYLSGSETFGTFQPSETVFLDTETTGLAGGAGTYAFLVGIGFFEERGFVVRQYLMPELSEEKDMLLMLQEHLQPFRSLVTFNGMSFDMPLLHTRYIMQGLRPAWRWEHHLDLLPVSRRLWRGRFESCRLSCLEEEVCGFRRVGDIPGYAIPPLYVRFLKERRLSLLEPVMEHNVWDIASLAALAVSACRIIEGGETLDLEGGWDFAAAGKAFAGLDVPDLSMECYREALNHDLPEEKRRAVLHGVGTFLKGEKRWDEAVEIWQQIRGEYNDDYLSRVELAKCFEHRLKDLDAALEPALEARRLTRSGASAAKERESERRVERLREKLERRASGKGEGR